MTLDDILIEAGTEALEYVQFEHPEEWSEQEKDGFMVSKVMLLVEYTAGNGQRHLFSARTQGITHWDAAGILTTELEDLSHHQHSRPLAEEDGE